MRDGKSASPQITLQQIAQRRVERSEAGADPWRRMRISWLMLSDAPRTDQPPSFAFSGAGAPCIRCVSACVSASVCVCDLILVCLSLRLLPCGCEGEDAGLVAENQRADHRNRQKQTARQRHGGGERERGERKETSDEAEQRKAVRIQPSHKLLVQRWKCTVDERSRAARRSRSAVEATEGEIPPYDRCRLMEGMLLWQQEMQLARQLRVAASSEGRISPCRLVASAVRWFPLPSRVRSPLCVCRPLFLCARFHATSAWRDAASKTLSDVTGGCKKK